MCVLEAGHDIFTCTDCASDNWIRNTLNSWEFRRHLDCVDSFRGTPSACLR